MKKVYHAYCKQKFTTVPIADTILLYKSKSRFTNGNVRMMYDQILVAFVMKNILLTVLYNHEACLISKVNNKSYVLLFLFTRYCFPFIDYYPHRIGLTKLSFPIF